MHRDGGRGAAREILVVVAVALSGLLLVGLAAFTPWYGRSGDLGDVPVVDVRSPAGPGVNG
jgi:hypothetical protein